MFWSAHHLRPLYFYFTESSELFQQSSCPLSWNGGRGGRNRESVPNVAHPTFLSLLKWYKFQTSKILLKTQSRIRRTVNQASNYAVTSHCHVIAAFIFDLKLHAKHGKPFLLKRIIKKGHDINKSAISNQHRIISLWSVSRCLYYSLNSIAR